MQALRGIPRDRVGGGARRVSKLDANVRAATAPLPSDIVRRLNAVTQPVLDKLGASFDY
jgi:aryl-alcohol dehydrogenase-like predicted oxidoreductase